LPVSKEPPDKKPRRNATPIAQLSKLAKKQAKQNKDAFSQLMKGASKGKGKK
jgi:hypothetical protein